MSRNFYFGKIADIVTGSATFAAAIATDFASLGLTSGQSTAFGALNVDLQTKYALSNDNSTRTPVAIQATKQAIVTMRGSATNLAKIIYSTSTVDDAQLVALGLKPRPTRTPRPVPVIPPQVEVLSVAGRIVKIRLHDIESERRGLPFGAKSVNLYSYIGATPATDPTQYQFQGVSTRALTEIQFPDSVASGATAWITAQWVSARGQMSIGSTPVAVTVQGGPISVAA